MTFLTGSREDCFNFALRICMSICDLKMNLPSHAKESIKNFKRKEIIKEGGVRHVEYEKDRQTEHVNGAHTY